MEYGEEYNNFLVNRFTKEKFHYTATYKRAAWGDFHTDNEGNGLWRGDVQIVGTCQFTVAGCKTEKAAKDKIRRFVHHEI